MKHKVCWTAARDDPDAPPNVITARRRRRLLDGLLLGRSSRPDWASLLRRSLDVDALDCPRRHGRLRLLDVVPEPEDARRILQAAGLPVGPAPVAGPRDPTDEQHDRAGLPGGCLPAGRAGRAGVRKSITPKASRPALDALPLVM